MLDPHSPRAAIVDEPDRLKGNALYILTYVYDVWLSLLNRPLENENEISHLCTLFHENGFDLDMNHTMAFVEPAISRLIVAGEFIRAIKLYRNVTRSSLIEAKDYVDQLRSARIE